MRLTVRLLGIEVLHFDTDPEPAAHDLSGGTVSSTPINLAWRPGQGIDHEPESPYEE